MIGIARVEQALPGFRLEQDAGREYQTLAGFVVKRLGRLPKEGETFEEQDYGRPPATLLFPNLSK